jgi:transposase
LDSQDDKQGPLQEILPLKADGKAAKQENGRRPVSPPVPPPSAVSKVILCKGRVRRIIDRMKPPIFVRPLHDSERQAIHAGLRSPDAFTLRRAQILLASAEGRTPAQIAAGLGCATQTVRNAIRSFQAAGVACLREGSHRPVSTGTELNGVACERLRSLLHRSPRDFGKPTSLWTLDLVAQVAFTQGITSRAISGESIRQALMRMGIGWKRAKRWITSPDPAYPRKKGRATA